MKDVMNLKKINGCLVPHILTDLQKSKRVTITSDLLQKLNSLAKEDLLNNYVIQDESWIYFQQNFNKISQMAWVSAD